MEKQQDIFDRISLEALFNNSLDAIVKVDKHHIITIVNKAFIDLFGFSPEQVLGKHLDDVLNMAKPGSANRNGTELVKSGHQFEEEAIRYNNKGRASAKLPQNLKTTPAANLTLNWSNCCFHSIFLKLIYS